MRFELKQIFFLSVLVFIMPFENCSQPEQDSGLSALSSESSAPFAYQSKLDTLAFMSCDGDQSANPRAYFNVRAGAYAPNMGMGLNPSFYSTTQYMTPDMRAAAIPSSDNSSATYMNFSMRMRSNYQTYWSTTGGYNQGNEVDQFLPILSADQITGPLAAMSSGSMRNYFPSATGDKRLMEASLSFAQDGTPNAVTQLQSSYELVAGYTSTGDALDETLRSPADFNPSNTLQSNTNVVYGTGYQLAFRSGGRALSNVSETSIDGSQTAGSWSCNQIYMIIRLEDLPQPLGTCTANCAAFSQTQDPLPSTSNYAPYDQQYANLRHVLRAEDWALNLVNPAYTTGTLVYKGHDGDHCYSSSNSSAQSAPSLPINYGAGLNCTPTTTYRCPHFATVCTRN